jgi:hypothetical protein
MHSETRGKWKMFGTGRDETRREWRKLHKEQLHIVIVRVIT